MIERLRAEGVKVEISKSAIGAVVTYSVGFLASLLLPGTPKETGLKSPALILS